MEQQCWGVRGCAPVAYRDCRALSPVSRVPQAAVFVDIFACAEDWLRCLHVSPAASPRLAVPAGCCSPAVCAGALQLLQLLFWREGMAGCSGCWESPLAGCAVLLSQPSELMSAAEWLGKLPGGTGHLEHWLFFFFFLSWESEWLLLYFTVCIYAAEFAYWAVFKTFVGFFSLL